jgi:hypothetical protein
VYFSKGPTSLVLRAFHAEASRRARSNASDSLLLLNHSEQLMIYRNTLYMLWHTAEAMDYQGGPMAFADQETRNRLHDKWSAPGEQAEQQNGNDYVTDAVLADALEPLLEALFLEGHTHVAAASPGTVAKLACLLERLLIANGIVPQSKRAEDPQAYVRDLQRTQDRAFREEFKARCRDLRRAKHFPIASNTTTDAESSEAVRTTP